MCELIFRENNDKYDDKVIEVGRWHERNDGSKFFSSVLDICPVNKEVRTDCGDSYMDYSIDFDTFLEVADTIKKLRKERAKDIKEKILRKENK